jgi:AcrR family transcriptional regulator
MAAPDRRRAILDVVVPLLIERGSSVTTAEMAHAAGIAEGTLFRAFPDKAVLIFEAVKTAMDPAPVAETIRAIGPSAPMRTQLVEAVRILSEHLNRVIALGEQLRSMPPPDAARKADVRRLIVKSSAVVSAALNDLFVRHAERLRVPPSTAIGALRGLVIASSHPLLPPSERLTVDEVVAILLSGIGKPGSS